MCDVVMSNMKGKCVECHGSIGGPLAYIDRSGTDGEVLRDVCTCWSVELCTLLCPFVRQIVASLVGKASLPMQPSLGQRSSAAGADWITSGIEHNSAPPCMAQQRMAPKEAASIPVNVASEGARCVFVDGVD